MTQTFYHPWLLYANGGYEKRPKHQWAKTMTTASFPEKFVNASTKGCLYILFCEEIRGTVLCKIGISKKPLRRFKNLSTMVPVDCMMMWTAIGSFWDAEEVEKSAHRVEKPFHSRREWFSYEKERITSMVARVESLCSAKTGVPVIWNYISGESA